VFFPASFFHPGAVATDMKLHIADISCPQSLLNTRMNAPSQRAFRRLTVDHDRRELRYIELAGATTGFTSTLLGQGGFATVHIGKVKGVQVAVKKDKDLGKLTQKGEKFMDQQFLTEVLVLYECRHPNICKLLYHCIDGPARCLVYEFCANGALSDRLRISTVDKPTFTWSQRLKIAVESARGLKYLHTLAKPVVHRDIKGSNVLISDKFEAKLCDFGTVRKMTRKHIRLSMDGGIDGAGIDGAGIEGVEAMPRKSSYVVSTLEAEVKIGTSAYMPPECK
jgi:serine/threonine protein kinase